MLQIYEDLFKSPEQAKLTEFISLMCEVEPLASYLYDCQDMNFEDLLDVIDDTSFETDALIKDMITVKAAFQQIFDTIKKGEKESGIKQLLAASRALANFRRKDIGDLFR